MISAESLAARPWIWSYLGALMVWLASIAFTGGYGAGGMITAVRMERGEGDTPASSPPESAERRALGGGTFPG